MCVGVEGELQDLERSIVELQEKILVRLEETRNKLSIQEHKTTQRFYRNLI